MNSTSNILFLSHGGGPLPLLGDAAHAEMLQCLRQITTMISRPAAIIVISAHWEASIATITAGSNPKLIYDYYGFPEESYSIQYPGPGHSELAKHLYETLLAQEIPAKADHQRGFDHGLFVPLNIMYPEANIPCIQLSLLDNLDPEQHIRLGQALQALDYDDLLIIGSGFSFHNLRAFFAADSKQSRAQNEAFEQWLGETCGNPKLSEQQRTQRLLQWEQAPAARYCHPREEHLLPLHVCYGMAQSACTHTFQIEILNKRSSMFLWQFS